MSVLTLARDSSREPSLSRPLRTRNTQRRARYASASAAGVESVSTGPQANYLECVVKLIPSEILVVYVLLQNLLADSTATKCIVMIIAFVLIPLLGWLGSRIARRSDPSKTEGWVGSSVLSASAFAVYICAYPGGFLEAIGLSLKVGSGIAILE